MGIDPPPVDRVDRFAWQAIITGRPVEWEHADERGGLLSRGITLPLRSFGLSGYPAALHAYRHVDQPPLSEEEVTGLRAAVETYHQSYVAARVRLFVLDQTLVPLRAADDWAALGDGLRQTLTDQASELLQKVSAEAPLATDRSPLKVGTDFFAARYSAHFAHPWDGKPAVVISLQPTVAEWVSLRTEDYAADHEFARFLPAIRYIHDAASEGPTLLRVARSAHLSPFHFHRKFAETIGMTPKQFLLECQIAKAQSLLLDGELKLATVAKRCGFAHQSHFTSRFKQATGLTPTSWRRRSMSQSSAI
jgi:AraC-like DNA-binding protein